MSPEYRVSTIGIVEQVVVADDEEQARDRLMEELARLYGHWGIKVTPTAHLAVKTQQMRSPYARPH